MASESNAIVAIPKLLAMMDVENAIMTIDAMGCQRDIASTIIEKRADAVHPLTTAIPAKGDEQLRS